MKEEFFNIKFDNLNRKEALKKIEEYLSDDKQHFIVFPYSEFIVRACKNKRFREILNKASLCLCEGRGLFFCLKLLGFSGKEEINGIGLIHDICGKFSSLTPKVFLMGGRKGIAKKAAEKLGNNIVGYEYGYGNFNKTINKINEIKPSVLLVGLGSPKQENWIFKNLKKMPSVKIAVGVGGAFDFISKKIKRAPRFIQKIGLEWLWRLIIQPRRIKRISRGIIGLSWLTLKERIKKTNKKQIIND